MIEVKSIFNVAFPVWVAALGIVLAVTVALMNSWRTSQKEMILEGLSAVLPCITLTDCDWLASLLDSCRESGLSITLQTNLVIPADLANAELERRITAALSVFMAELRLPESPEHFLGALHDNNLTIIPRPDHLTTVRLVQSYFFAAQFASLALLMLAVVVSQSIPNPNKVAPEFITAMSYSAYGSLGLSCVALLVTAYFLHGLHVLDALRQLLRPNRRHYD
jgi:hypothetical protein